MKLSADWDQLNLNQKFDQIERNQLPFALSLALNLTAQDIKDTLRITMQSVFRNPTPFALGGVHFSPAKKTRPFVELDAASTVRGDSVLKAEVFGGLRKHKAMENALIRKGLMPNDRYWMPSKYVDRDGYGNQSPGQIVKLLAYFQTFRESGHRMNTTEKKKMKMATGTKKRYGTGYFIGQPGNGKLPLGIYERTTGGLGSRIKPLVIFGKTPHYQKRLPFFEIADTVFNRRFRIHFNEAYEQAMRTAFDTRE